VDKTDKDKIQKVAVVGAGLMGHGIAQEWAQAGYHVRITDTHADTLAAVPQRIRHNYDLLVEAELVVADQADQTLGRLDTVAELEDCVADADLVIEAMAEDLQAKRALFGRLDALCPPHTLLATNSSSFMPGQIANATQRADKVLGTHYFNPPYLVPLVEIIRSPQTTDTTVDTLYHHLSGMGKEPVTVQKEVPGFIGNRIQAAVLREALSLVEQGVATPQDVDRVIRNSIGRRWSVAGVFEIAEAAGLDLKLKIMEQLVPAIESSAQVSALLRDKVKDGKLGMKTGEGFYTWSDDKAQATRQRIARALIAINALE
jgi:3-hydroxybutyryl-CoA dehydrogenase